MTFKNPVNGYTVTPGSPFGSTLLFGTFYFLKHGVWGHALMSAVAAVLTVGISWFIYPFLATAAIRHHYLSQGWVEIETPPQAPHDPSKDTVLRTRTILALAVASIVIVAIVATVALLVSGAR